MNKADLLQWFHDEVVKSNPSLSVFDPRLKMMSQVIDEMRIEEQEKSALPEGMDMSVDGDIMISVDASDTVSKSGAMAYAIDYETHGLTPVLSGVPVGEMNVICGSSDQGKSMFDEQLDFKVPKLSEWNLPSMKYNEISGLYSEHATNGFSTLSLVEEISKKKAEAEQQV